MIRKAFLSMVASKWRSARLILLVFGLTAFFVAACGDSGSDEAAPVSETPEASSTENGDLSDTDSGDSETGDSETGDSESTEPTDQTEPSDTAEDGSLDDSADEPAESSSESEAAPTGPFAFSTHVAPVLAANCATCHSTGGPGSPHFELSAAKDAVTFASFIKNSVTAGAMPPWPATDLSVPFHSDRSLSEDEVARIVKWVDDGSELDVAEDSPIDSSEPLFRLSETDDTLKPLEGYQGIDGQTDDYRCLAFPANLEEDTFLLGWEFLPDKAEVVHHAIGNLAGPDQADRIAELDAADPGPGWSCYGSSGVQADSGIFLAWAPGQGPTEYPTGTGLRAEAGSTVVIQIHYHYEDTAPLDVSSLDVNWADESDGDIEGLQIRQLIGPAEIPCRVGETNPLCDRSAALAKNFELYGAGIGSGVPVFINSRCDFGEENFERTTDGLASSTCDLNAPGGEIVSIMAHEHEIGTSWRLTLNPDTPEEKVLLDIDEWDFDWQYNYYPQEQIVLDDDDVLRLDCAWDRDLIKEGLDLGYILWADGTNDEMCFANMVMRDAQS